MPLDQSLSFRVAPFRIGVIMTCAIDLEGKMQLGTIEIDDILADAVLSPKLVAQQLGPFEVEPEHDLCARAVCAQVLTEVSLVPAVER